VNVKPYPPTYSERFEFKISFEALGTMSWINGDLLGNLNVHDAGLRMISLQVEREREG
jgi:hypothetical protein